MKRIRNLLYLLVLLLLFLYQIKYDDSHEDQIVQREEIKMSPNKSEYTINKLNDLKKASKKDLEDLKNWKKILVWTKYFQSMNVWDSIFKRIISGECEESRCHIIVDKSEILDADAVFFNAYNLRNVRDISLSLQGHVTFDPPTYTRSADQIYIFYSMESPHKLDRNYLSTLPPNFFNWTMGYRTDSDVVEPFGTITKKPQLSPRNTVRYLSQSELKKKKFSVWISSSCYKYVPFLREYFLEHLRKLVQVDIYGKCGKKCDEQFGLEMYNKTFGRSPCERKVKDYLFYLTLENSLCKDYASEKIFKAWNLGAIPVVFGAANYSSFAPPKSYIDFRDFSSMSELVKYMKKIANDAKLYNQYFKWKEDYDVVVGNPYDPFVCDLCKKLHQQTTERKTKSYKNIHDWFVVKGSCKKSLDGIISFN